MAIITLTQLNSGTYLYIGLSSDTKPAATSSAIFIETNTGTLFYNVASVWTAVASVGAPGSGVWGSITGTLSDQGDLVSALAAKQNLDSELTALAGLTSAADRLPYFTGSGTAALQVFTSQGRALVDDADAAAQRTTLGLGTIATQAASSVSLTGGSITGITDLAVADGGTGSSTASAARTALGLAIGTDVQAQSVALDTFAAAGAGLQNDVLYNSAADTPTWAPPATMRSVLSLAGFSLGVLDDIPIAGTFTIFPYATVAFRITQLKQAKVLSGSLTLAVAINGTPITGLSAVGITTSPSDTSATAARDVAIGDRVTVTYSSVSSAVSLEGTLLGTRL